MKILHTSDWHIGRTLYGRKRYEEFDAFLRWLADTIEQEKVDALLVAGDIFDTSTPSNRAQALYYQFLCRVAQSCCRHVVVIAGNHDSPSFLDAPRELLKSMNVHVVGSASDCPDDEVIVLRDPQGEPELIVCAVPYLRDRDIRTAEAGESVEDKERKLLEGIRRHYAQVAAQAEAKRQRLDRRLPVVGMGHLFTAGGKTLEGDGVRELYVGSLAHVAANMFPDSFDYLALGHLHVPQKVGGSDTIRYCGSPLAMGFGEAAQAKSVCLVSLSADSAAGAGHDIAGSDDRQVISPSGHVESRHGRPAVEVALLDVPVFQPLARIKGDWADIAAALQVLGAEQSMAWVEIVYEGADLATDLRKQLDTAVAGTQIEILRVRNNRVMERVLESLHEDETLDDLAPDEVFERCLAAHKVPLAQQLALRDSYREVVISVLEEDTRAE
ncbi:exonuclease SbcCD subunit D C-terminal domain-containing protein [Allopusillimonas ginsengisoli]|uniref:exonuclease SbcCD subunit D C-terminal domain-containing protein n=1 Tax=Allopusillimonas ginsengisoli TaxID=453575 RepID=UPI00101ED46D|nr:exonuclease SbcCD subunit D C-terminal domain-containing protein [Allopusillimonas ginsengisoli]TEA79506.1 exonuclease subunit SbcD [Allopusillimonas ginsengisoli]